MFGLCWFLICFSHCFAILLALRYFSVHSPSKNWIQTLLSSSQKQHVHFYSYSFWDLVLLREIEREHIERQRTNILLFSLRKVIFFVVKCLEGKSVMILHDSFSSSSSDFTFFAFIPHWLAYAKWKQSFFPASTFLWIFLFLYVSNDSEHRQTKWREKNEQKNWRRNIACMSFISSGRKLSHHV